MTENELSYIIRGIIFKVYNTLGAGLLESTYESVLTYELRKAGLEVKTQLGLPLIYEEMKLEVGYRIDILVENKVIIKIKSVEELHEVYYKQLLTYLRLSNLKLGLLVNFKTTDMASSIKRIVNNL